MPPKFLIFICTGPQNNPDDVGEVDEHQPRAEAQIRGALHVGGALRRLHPGQLHTGEDPLPQQQPGGAGTGPVRGLPQAAQLRGHDTRAGAAEGAQRGAARQDEG